MRSCSASFKERMLSHEGTKLKQRNADLTETANPGAGSARSMPSHALCWRRSFKFWPQEANPERGNPTRTLPAAGLGQCALTRCSLLPWSLVDLQDDTA